MRLIDEKRINAVELDLKDESGIVGFARRVPLRPAGSAPSSAIYDLPAAVRQLHARRHPGHRAARLLPRPDPRRGRLEGGAQTRSSRRQAARPTPGYGGVHELRRARRCASTTSTSRSRPRARASTTSSTTTCAGRTGRFRACASPASTARPRPAIVGFLRESRAALRPYGHVPRRVGVRRRRDAAAEVAQDIAGGWRGSVDYVAPMVYPSHWGPGEYDVAQPERPAVRHRRGARSRDFPRDVAAPARASCRGCRTSRSA